MALKGVREPVAGIKGVKGPRSLRLPKVPRQSETETSVALGEEYLRKRNQILDLKFKREAMSLVSNCINQRKNVSFPADGLRVWSTRKGLRSGSSAR